MKEVKTMNKIKVSRDYAELKCLDDLGEAALKFPKLMDLIVNGRTLMSVKKDMLRGIIRVIITGAGAEVEQQTQRADEWRSIATEWQEKALNAEKQIATLEKALELACEPDNWEDCKETCTEKLSCDECFIQQAQKQEATT